MCDTQVLVTPEAIWFAKNSDREPSEPQPVVRLAPVRDDTESRVRTTYVEIDQVPHRHGVILSKPSWLWGAEIGVNDQGLCIGNEAIFSKGRSLTPALLGMDLVRLGLERAATAREAIDVMTALLTRHGQGGPAGFADKSFHYDNSFLLADAREAWVLETAGREWAAKRIESHYAISNGLTLGRDYDLHSPALGEAKPPFAASFDTRLMPFFAGTHRRRALGMQCLAQAAPVDFTRMTRHLRTHQVESGDPLRGSNGDVCMHAAGLIRRSQTTGSMVARLTPAGATVLVTGTSAPCLSIFRPVAFDGDFQVLTPEEVQTQAAFWHRHEWLHRRALGDAELRTFLRESRQTVESAIFAALGNSVPAPNQLAEADERAAAWQHAAMDFARQRPAPRLPRHWRTLNERDSIDLGGVPTGMQAV